MKRFCIAAFLLHVVPCASLLAKRLQNATRRHGNGNSVDGIEDVDFGFDFKQYAGSLLNAQHMGSVLSTCPKWRKYSQGSQDAIIHNLFEAIGVTNKYYVEFGFNADGFGVRSASGPNTELLHELGWQGLLMDGGHENAKVNLHKEWITPENIVELFAKYKVPKEPDFLTIDIDSCDLFVFKALVKEYRPRLLTIEYNSNYPLGVSKTNRCTSNGENYMFHDDNLFGASLSAIHKAAEENGYTVMYVEPLLDVFLLRKDLVVPGTEIPMSNFGALAGIPVHGATTPEEQQKWVEDY